jgi:hypothetical protein
VLASAVFRGDAGVSGPRLAGFGPGVGFGTGLIEARVEARPSVEAVPAAEAGLGALAADQAGMLGERAACWRWLHRPLREVIDGQASAAGEWARVRVEVSGHGSGNASDLIFRARAEGGGGRAELPHFVIGNGSRSGDGAMEATGRPLAGAEVAVLLIGGGPEDPPTEAQLRALTELIDYLRAKAGVIPVVAGIGGERLPGVRGVAAEALDLAFNRSLADQAGAPARGGAR